MNESLQFIQTKIGIVQLVSKHTGWAPALKKKCRSIAEIMGARLDPSCSLKLTPEHGQCAVVVRYSMEALPPVVILMTSYDLAGMEPVTPPDYPDYERSKRHVPPEKAGGKRKNKYDERQDENWRKARANETAANEAMAAFPVEYNVLSCKGVAGRVLGWMPAGSSVAASLYTMGLTECYFPCYVRKKTTPLAVAHAVIETGEVNSRGQKVCHLVKGFEIVSGGV